MADPGLGQGITDNIGGLRGGLGVGMLVATAKLGGLIVVANMTLAPTTAPTAPTVVAMLDVAAPTPTAAMLEVVPATAATLEVIPAAPAPTPAPESVSANSTTSDVPVGGLKEGGSGGAAANVDVAERNTISTAPTVLSTFR